MNRLIGKRVVSKFAFDSVKEVHKRRYLLQPIAVEVFCTDGQNQFLAFSKSIRPKVRQLTRYSFSMVFLGSKFKNLKNQWSSSKRKLARNINSYQQFQWFVLKSFLTNFMFSYCPIYVLTTFFVQISVIQIKNYIRISVKLLFFVKISDEQIKKFYPNFRSTKNSCPSRLGCLTAPSSQWPDRSGPPTSSRAQVKLKPVWNWFKPF